MKKRRPCGDSTSSAPTRRRVLAGPARWPTTIASASRSGLIFSSASLRPGGVRRHRRRCSISPSPPAATVRAERPLELGAIGDAPLRRHHDRRHAGIAARSPPSARHARRTTARRPARRTPCSGLRSQSRSPGSTRRTIAAGRRSAPRPSQSSPSSGSGGSAARNDAGADTVAAAAMAQHAAVPERAHAVVLLADEAPGRIDLAGIDRGELGRGRQLVRGRKRRRNVGRRRQRRPRERSSLAQRRARPGRASTATAKRSGGARPGTKISASRLSWRRADSGERRSSPAPRSVVENLRRGHLSPIGRTRRAAAAARPAQCAFYNRSMPVAAIALA